MAEVTSGVNNGVNVAALIAAREALTKAPAAAQFKWRAACEWKDGTHSHSTVEGFYGLGQEQHHKKNLTLTIQYCKSGMWVGNLLVANDSESLPFLRALGPD